MPRRRQDIPQATFDLLVDLRLRLKASRTHPLEVKKTWYEEAKTKCGPNTAQLVLWMIESVPDVELDKLQSAGPPARPANLMEPPLPLETSPEPEKPGMDYLAIIRAAIKAVPSVRYALGVAGIAAVVALVVAWEIDVRIALAGVVVMFVFMTVLVVFAGLSKLKHPHLTKAALFLMWAFVILFVAWAGLLTSSVFFNVPKSPDQLFGPANTT
jgi:hypothetical protein